MSYYCIVNTPGVPAREIAAFEARDDTAAIAEAHHVAARWPGFEVIVLYQGERTVSVLTNAALGFSAEPLDLSELAA